MLELGGEAFAEARRRHLPQLAHCVPILAAQPPRLRAKMVERRRARKLAEPGTYSTPTGIEAIPTAKCALERVDREVFGEGVVSGQVHEIGKNVVEVSLGDDGEALLLRVHGLITPQRAGVVTSQPTGTRACAAAIVWSISRTPND